MTVKDGVTSIGNDAFRECTAIVSMVLPASVTTLGEGAFRLCVSLQSLTLGGVKSVTPETFENCQALQTIFFYGTILEWEKSVLSSMSTLEDVTAFYYSEQPPATTGQHWRFVDGIPTLW